MGKEGEGRSMLWVWVIAMILCIIAMIWWVIAVILCIIAMIFWIIAMIRWVSLPEGRRISQMPRSTHWKLP